MVSGEKFHNGAVILQKLCCKCKVLQINLLKNSMSIKSRLKNPNTIEHYRSSSTNSIPQIIIYSNNMQSTFHVATWYLMPLFLSTCPKKLHCPFTTCFINCLSLLSLLNEFPFVTLLVQEIFIIHRKNQIPATSSSLFIASLTVHVIMVVIVKCCFVHFYQGMVS